MFTSLSILSKFPVDKHALHILGEYGLSMDFDDSLFLSVLAIIFVKIARCKQNFCFVYDSQQ
jgi:hypothetical protein